MDLELPDRYLAIREEARALGASIEHIAAEADAMSEIHPGVRQALAESGLVDLVVPKQFGGRFDQVDPLAVCVAREGVAATSVHLDTMLSMQGIGSFALSLAGAREHQERWLPRVANLDALVALGLTEEEAGSDLKAVLTTVDETSDGLVLRGGKTWISNGGVADLYTVLAREGDGYSLVLVPADTPGFSTTPIAEIIAPHVLSELRFDSVVLDPSHRVGEPGCGFDLVLSTLAVFRASVAGASIGLAEAALREASRHAVRRHQFGRPLARIGPVASMLADSWTDLEQARLLTYRAAARAAEDPLGNIHHSSMAKLAATEAAGRIVDRCVQIMGRWGLVRDSLVERAYRAARPMRIYEGATEVIKLGVAKGFTEEFH